MDLIRQFSAEQYAAALSSWAWLADGLAGLAATHATAFGDVFLRDSTGGFWFLDGMEGSLTRFWDSGSELQAALNTVEGQDQFLMVGLVQAAVAAGLAPGDGQVLTFKVPPVLGGQISIDNVEVGDFVVALDLAGQIHRQVKDLPPGASITGVELK